MISVGAIQELATELTGSTPSEIRTLGFDYNPAGQITEADRYGRQLRLFGPY